MDKTVVGANGMGIIGLWVWSIGSQAMGYGLDGLLNDTTAFGFNHLRLSGGRVGHFLQVWSTTRLHAGSGTGSLSQKVLHFLYSRSGRCLAMQTHR